jgi:hypothetical protein
LRAREIRLRHFAAYVRGASLDVAHPELNMQNASQCDTDQKMINNHRCIGAKTASFGISFMVNKKIFLPRQTRDKIRNS